MTLLLKQFPDVILPHVAEKRHAQTSPPPCWDAMSPAASA